MAAHATIACSLVPLAALAACAAPADPEADAMLRFRHEQWTLGTKAAELIRECEAGGARPFKLQGNYLAFDRQTATPHPAHAKLDPASTYRSGGRDITVFLVTGEEEVQLGTYSVSGAPAFQRSLHVCVVQFADIDSPGVFVLPHKIQVADPAVRQVGVNSPYLDRTQVDTTEALAKWIRELRSSPAR